MSRSGDEEFNFKDVAIDSVYLENFRKRKKQLKKTGSGQGTNGSQLPMEEILTKFGMKDVNHDDASESKNAAEKADETDSSNSVVTPTAEPVKEELSPDETDKDKAPSDTTASETDALPVSDHPSPSQVTDAASSDEQTDETDSTNDRPLAEEASEFPSGEQTDQTDDANEPVKTEEEETDAESSDQQAEETENTNSAVSAVSGDHTAEDAEPSDEAVCPDDLTKEEKTDEPPADDRQDETDKSTQPPQDTQETDTADTADNDSDTEHPSDEEQETGELQKMDALLSEMSLTESDPTSGPAALEEAEQPSLLPTASPSVTPTAASSRSEAGEKSKNGALRLIVWFVIVMLTTGIGAYMISQGRIPLQKSPSEQPALTQPVISGTDTASQTTQPQETEATVPQETQSTTETTAATTTTTAAPLYPALKKGDQSDDVLNMQKRLCKLGYMDAESCTGYFGPFTEKRIKMFQKKAGLPQTGAADSDTLTRLYADDAPKCVS